jgi:hypothetical protein
MDFDPSTSSLPVVASFWCLATEVGERDPRSCALSTLWLHLLGNLELESRALESRPRDLPLDRYRSQQINCQAAPKNMWILQSISQREIRFPVYMAAREGRSDTT